LSQSRLVVVSLVWALSALSPMPALADDQVVAPDPRAVTLPSFTESPGCDGPYGIRGPYASHGGYLPPEELVLGPWGGFYGRTMEEVHDQMVLVEMPMADRPFALYVHRRVVPALEQVIANLEREAAAGRHYTIRAAYSSSYNPITIPPGRYLSFHAVGAALDINSNTNPYRADNVLVTDMPAWFVKAWTDAGWCWGGSWRDVKDPTHFSWMGPLHSTGHEAPAPYPPLTSASTFARSVSFDTALGEAPAGSIHLVADMDRDGAPDAVRLREWTPYGHLGVEVAIGQHDFETCLLHDITVQPPRAGAGYALADWRGDGRPDLWAFDAGGPTVRVEVYRWETRYRKRAVIRPAVSSDGVVALLAGDHDRDGIGDLYVVRAGSPGSVEVWAGPRFATRLASADLGVDVSSRHRLALGDYDVDGVPDVYLLAAGDAAVLRVALGGRGFALVAPVRTAVGAHPASTLQIADYDGDGREDLVFFDQTGRVTVYLGGRRAADAPLTGWFSESFDRHWQFGDGCVPNPGFETEPGFRGTRLADASGPGAAFTYPIPHTGAWTVAALDWSWWGRLPGRFVDLEPITGAEGPGYAILLAGTETTVRLRKAADGQEYATVWVSERTGPVDLAVAAHGGHQVVAVAFSGSRPGVVIRDQAGALLADVDLTDLVPYSLAAVSDVSGDGSQDLAVVGYLADGGIGLRTVSIASGVVATGRVASGFSVEGITAVPSAGGRAASVAVLLRHNAGRRGAVAVLDAATGARLLVFRTPPITTGAVTAARTGDGTVLVLAARNARTGRVRVEGRDPSTGQLLWARKGSLGFDPADIDQIEAGSVLVTGHRFGDGNVEVAWWNPATGERLG
jgi:hypothetical protein